MCYFMYLVSYYVLGYAAISNAPEKLEELRTELSDSQIQAASKVQFSLPH